MSVAQLLTQFEDPIEWSTLCIAIFVFNRAYVIYIIEIFPLEMLEAWIHADQCCKSVLHEQNFVMKVDNSYLSYTWWLQ